MQELCLIWPILKKTCPLHYSCLKQSDNLYVKPGSHTHTHTQIYGHNLSRYITVAGPSAPSVCPPARLPALALGLSPPLSSRPNQPGLISPAPSLIWRRGGRHPPTSTKTNFTVPPSGDAPQRSLSPSTRTRMYECLHLSLSHLHGRGQEGGGRVRGRKVSASKEFIILRCHSQSGRSQEGGEEERMGGSTRERESGEGWGGGDEGGGAGVCFTFVWLLVISQMFVMACGVGWHPPHTNQSSYCLFRPHVLSLIVS